MQKKWLRLAIVPVALSLVAASCASDDDGDSSSDDSSPPAATEAPDGTDDGSSGEGGDFGGATVTITGPERDEPSLVAVQDTLDAFGEANNINIEYSGDADWEANIQVQAEGGNLPSIGIFPQPGLLASFAADGIVMPLDDATNASVDEYWSDDFQINGAVDGTQYGVPVKTDLKSLVWYIPSNFEAAGYEVPETFDDFLALIEQIKEDGNGKPLCVGIESGAATGWPFTDWVEEMVLRQQGGDVYDQWVANEVKFDDPEIIEAMQTVADLWADENVYSASGSIVATAFQDNAQPLLDGDCFMHRQASFFSGMFPEGTAFADGSEGAVDVFYFPDINGDRPVLTAGTFAGAFNEDPATMAVLAYMATADYAEKRQAAQTEFLDGGLSGFLSAAQGQDPSVYQPLEQGFLEILNGSELSRFDASDLMPTVVGSGSFWSEGVSLVNGDETVEEAAANIQATWPN